MAGTTCPHVVSPSTGQPGLCTGRSWGESRDYRPSRLCNTHWALPHPWDELASSCAPLFLTPRSVMSGWQPEISHTRRVHTEKLADPGAGGMRGKSVVPASTGHILSAKMSHEVKPDSRDGKQMGDWLSMFHLEFSQLQHQRSRVPRAPAPGKPLGLVTLGADTLLGEKQQSHIARCRQGSWARSSSIASSDSEP